MKRIGDILTRNKTAMIRLGDHIHEESHAVGKDATKFHLVGVSNELGLVPSPRESAADDLSRYQRVKRDWFVYNPMRVNVGSIGLADDDSKTGITSPDYTVFSCRDSLDPRYLLHFLKSNYGLEAIARQCSGAVRKRLYYSGLAEIELPIPPLERQREVLAHIQSIQNAVNFTRSELIRGQTIAKLKQAILQEAIQGKLTADWRAAHPDVEPASQLLHRIQDEKARLIAAKKLRPEKPLPKITPAEIPFEIPRGWEWCRLGGVIGNTDSGWSPACLKREASAGKWGVLKTTAVQIREYLEHENKELPPALKQKPEMEAKPGDILMTRAGPANRVGICCLIRTTRPNLMISDKIVRFHPLITDPEYIELFAATPQFQKLIETSKQGMAQSQVNISRGNLTATIIPLPPLAEQAAIVERVEALMTTCRALEAEIGHARTHAAHLLQAVLKEAFAPATGHSSAGSASLGLARA